MAIEIPRFDPLPGFNFLIALLDTSSTFSTITSGVLGLALGGFSECEGLESTLEIQDYQEGGVNDRVHRFPSRFTYGNVTLKRGVGFGEDLWLWHEEFLKGEGKRRDVLIILQNDLKIPIKIWTLSRALPVRWQGPSLNATTSEIAIEALEMAHEKLELLVSPGALLDGAAGAVSGAIGF